MFIREINKKNPGSDKIYTYHRLMESVRTPRGPRQRTLLNLGELKLPRDQWKALANRIEEIVTGQGALYPVPETLEELARKYAQELRQKEIRAGAMIEEHPPEATMTATDLWPQFQERYPDHAAALDDRWADAKHYGAKSWFAAKLQSMSQSGGLIQDTGEWHQVPTEWGFPKVRVYRRITDQ